MLIRRSRTVVVVLSARSPAPSTRPGLQEVLSKYLLKQGIRERRGKERREGGREEKKPLRKAMSEWPLELNEMP